MQKFDFLGLETAMDGDKIRAHATGTLAAVVQPFVDRFFSVLNSLKVIAKKNGANVYNLYNPPAPTPAGMRALERKLKEVVFKTVFPATANLAVTHKCQCKCVHCSADPFVNPSRHELTTEEIKTVVDGALDLGASLVIFTGGEPLIRPDLFDLISHVDPDKAQPMIFTNGQYLTETNCRKLAQAGLGSLYVSVDHPDPAEHNRLRGVPDLYEMALEGAARAREHGILVGISTYATHDRVTDGSLERLINLGIERKFNEVTIFDCIPSGNFLKDTSCILTSEERRGIVELVNKYHYSDAPIGIIAQCIVNSPEGAGCFGAHSEFYMTAYGDINPCDFNPISFGNVTDLPVQVIWHKMVSHPDFKLHHKTCRMQTSAYRAKYIDLLPPNPRLPIPIEEIEALAAKALK